MLVSMDRPGVVGILKTLAPDLTTFLSFDDAPGTIATPSFARAQTRWFAATRDATGVAFSPLTDGRPGTAVQVPVGPSLDVGTASCGDFAVAVFESTDNTFGFAGINDGLETISLMLPTEGRSPRIACNGNDGLIAMGAAGGIRLASITFPMTLQGQKQLTLTGRDPHVSWRGNARCVMWLDGGIQLARDTGSGFTIGRVNGLPAGDPDAWDFEDDLGVAVYGSAVYTFPACL
jgi:hypothetical protein